MLCLTHRTKHYENLQLYDVIKFENETYVIVDIGKVQVSHNGELVTNLVVQNIHEPYDNRELTSSISAPIRIKDAQFKSIQIGQYGSVADSNRIVKLVNFRSLEWDSTDLLVQYIAELIPMLSPITIQQILKKHRIKTVKNINKTVIQVKFT